MKKVLVTGLIRSGKSTKVREILDSLEVDGNSILVQSLKEEPNMYKKDWLLRGSPLYTNRAVSSDSYELGLEDEISRGVSLGNATVLVIETEESVKTLYMNKLNKVLELLPKLEKLYVVASMNYLTDMNEPALKYFDEIIIEIGQKKSKE